MFQGKFTPTAIRVLLQEADALRQLANGLDAVFDEAVDCLLHISGRIAVTGMGKSGHVARKVAATLSSTGSPAFFIHPAEASHGDLGMLGKGDAVLAFSNSGETLELVDTIEYAARNRLPLLAVTQRRESTLGRHADYVLALPQIPEACPIGCAPTTSTTMQLALGDALALTLLQARGFRPEDFRQFHPGGRLGKKLRLLKEIMHRGDALPLARPDTPMGDVIYIMSSKGFGAVGIVEDDLHLVGFISDGDLRRHMAPDLLQKTARDIMSPHPFSLSPDCLVERAIALLSEHKITSSFVIEREKVTGFIHMHDLL
ncbi:KpsF/GutQ family sugar-phosphate isomerase [uncultured Desulfovibrio sp.]|uniref:KpsF/GutQ family sugar-phosphate isomerase n=1 Tax=uncultured Desulfovibrio sp. TaxID=167968 RepID=UPI00260233E4|nr:KpsF/GutQ family sugar-phosphate isomerase [uncultured Desulfovibrio sp.]